MPSKPGTFSYAKRGCRFTWGGGEYITVHIEGQPIEAINVWQYDGSDKPLIGRDQVSFVGACEEWLKGIDGDALRIYIAEARSMKRGR